MHLIGVEFAYALPLQQCDTDRREVLTLNTESLCLGAEYVLYILEALPMIDYLDTSLFNHSLILSLKHVSRVPPPCLSEFSCPLRAFETLQSCFTIEPVNAYG